MAASLLRALVLLSAVFTAPALAQDPVVVEARSALSTYDVGEGGRSLRSLRELAALAARGDAEARYLRAFAGTELLVASLVGQDGALRVRLAEALGVGEADLRAHLTSELAAATGTFRAGAAVARELLTMTDEAARDPLRLAARRGPQRDAFFVFVVARGAGLSDLAADPCAGEAMEPLVCGWDERARREAGAVREGIRAAERARRAGAEGDPLLALLGPSIAAAVTAITAIDLHPTVELPEALGAAAVPDAAPDASYDALAVVAEARVHLRALPIVRVRADGTFATVRGAGGGVEVDLPRELPAVPQALDAVVTAAAGLGLPSGARVGIAPTETVPAHLVTRVVLSLVRAGLTPSHFVGERSDESLAGVPFTVVRSAELETIGARVRVQMGAYGFGRGARGRESRIPRVRTATGLEFDVAALAERLASGTFTAVSLDAMATVPGVELMRAAFLIATPTRSLVYVVP
jgi:hypothetical protein